MARVRQIKPDFFTDKKLVECGYPAMVLFAGLWTIADREGRLKDIPFWIHGQVFPFDKTINIDALLSQLVVSGLIDRYKIDSDLYIQVVNFNKHQKPHTKEADSVIPCNPKTRSPGKGSAQPGKRQCSAREKAVLSRADSNSNSNTGIRNTESNTGIRGIGEPSASPQNETESPVNTGLSIQKTTRFVPYEPNDDEF